MIGQTISHYQIIEKLGEGGMGVVYKALDTKLNRFVALKFLPPELTHDAEAVERFVNEAQTASSLDHANICTIHEINEMEEGQLYIVMAYYAGETLQEKVRSNQLSVDRAIDIAMQTAQGLLRAHEAGITHRDIKPSNLIITPRGEVKIIDFGLAKLAGPSRLTKSGSTPGTVAYMSPEQVQGKPVDQRTDIWSFGVVLYEMLTGQLPFRGENEAAVIFSIVSEEPETLAQHRAEVAEGLQRIVDKALDKDLETRYQNISDLMADLATGKQDSLEPPYLSKRRKKSRPQKEHLLFSARLGISLLATVTVVAGYFLLASIEESKARLTIAVVDFVNETNERELEGLSSMLITALQQSQRLSVLTRSRMFDILKTIGKKDVDRIDESLGRAICEQANVKAMIIATIRKFARHYVIDLKVLDSEKDEYLFATKVQGLGHESILMMIDNLAAKTRKGLNEKDEDIQTTGQNIAQVTTANLQAYQYYFQGEQFIDKLEFKKAKTAFEKAIALDSTFGLAYYRLSYISLWSNSEPIDYNYVLQKAVSLLDRIPEKERYLVRAEYERVHSGGWPAALSVLKEMEKKYPDDKEMLFIIGDGSYHLGDHPTALRYLENVLSMDPTHERALQHLVRTCQDMGNYEKMLAVAERYAAITSSSEAYAFLGSAYAWLGRYEPGLQKLKKARELFPQKYGLTETIANLYTLQGKYKAAGLEIQTLIEEKQPPQVKHLGYEGLRSLCVLLGKYRQAMQICEKEIELYWQEKDTTRIGIMHIRKALLRVYGWNDVVNAWEEIKKAFRFEDKIFSAIFQTNLFDLYAYHGDYEMADSLLQTGLLVIDSNRALLHSIKGECKEAEVYANVVLKSSEPWRKIFVLYPLAKCQFEAGELDKALNTALQIQKYFNSFSRFRALYYPKSLYLLGRIYEKMGRAVLSLQNYEKLLSLWKEADEDLPELMDAKARFAELKRMTGK